MKEVLTIERGDQMRMNTKMIDHLNRKSGGVSLLVKVINIIEGDDGVKILTVQSVNTVDESRG